MATAGTASLTTGVSTIYNGQIGQDDAQHICHGMMVTNTSGSSGLALINIQGLEAAGEYVPLAPGVTMVFTSAAGISKVTATSDGTATVYFGIVLKR